MPDPARRSSDQRQRPGRRLLWRALLALGFLMLIGAVLLVGYLMQLDRRITTTFEGRRWSVPALVYAQPLELYPGLALSAPTLIEELERVGYVATREAALPGEYRVTSTSNGGAQIALYLRGFQFAEGPRSAQRIDITFRSGRVATISDPTAAALPLIRLDPPTIGSIYPNHGEDRVVLAPDQVPELLREALKTVEDQRFEDHPGFDLRGIARAAWTNLRSGELDQGGSTLTQQLVKSYFLTNERTLRRKLKEVAMAVVLEARFSKADLMNAYINEIYLGQAGLRAIHGFGLGAQFYFNKPLNELGAAEIATLVAIIRGPTYYNPYRHPKRVNDRRNRILELLAGKQLVSAELLADALATPLSVVTGRRRGGTYYPAFMELVRDDLGSSYDAQQLASDGLRIFSTLNPRLQDHVDAVVSDRLNSIEARLARANADATPRLEAAVVITDTQTGEVLALSGGRNARYDGYNRALNARRPVGSLIKPAVYLSALERGATLATQIEDRQIVLTDDNGTVWAPQNFDGKTYGTVSLARGLADSLNLATVQLGLDLGVPLIGARLEALSGHPPRNRFPSLLLGAEEMTALEVTTLYANFASGGFRLKPRSVITVLDERNAPLSHHAIDLAPSIDPATNALLVHGLQLTMEQGTGKSSQHRAAGVAGKTGTSDDFRDSWFAGFDANRLAVVWIGTDDNQPTGLTGSSGALRVWDAIMAQTPPQRLPQAALPIHARIDFASGYAVPDGCELPETIDLPFRTEPELTAHPDCSASSGPRRRLPRWLGGRQRPVASAILNNAGKAP